MRAPRRPVNEQISDRCRSWIPETIEALQERCFGVCIGIGDSENWKGQNVSVVSCRFSARPWY
ncbi:hypothetical protein SFRURICE_008486, partial [Spodoptera frugiperda]